MIVKLIHNYCLSQAKTKEAKTRLGALAVLRALVACASAKTLAPHAALLVASVERSLAASDKDGSNLRIEALVLLRHLLSDADPQTYVPHVQTLTPLVVAAVGDGVSSIYIHTMLFIYIFIIMIMCVVLSCVG